VCLLGAVVAKLCSGAPARGLSHCNPQLRQRPCPRVALGQWCRSECDAGAGAVAHVVVVMRPKDDVDDDGREATGVGMVDGQMSRKPPTAPSSRLRPRSLGG